MKKPEINIAQKIKTLMYAAKEFFKSTKPFSVRLSKEYIKVSSS